MPEFPPVIMVFSMDFWSNPDDEFLLNAVANDKALPDVVVAGIPALATVIRAIAIFKCRVIEDTSGAPNGINGTQYIQVKKAAGAYINAITLVDNMWLVAANTREGGDIIVGSHDVSGQVVGNGTYNFITHNVVVDAANLKLNDVKVGLKIYFK